MSWILGILSDRPELFEIHPLDRLQESISDKKHSNIGAHNRYENLKTEKLVEAQVYRGLHTHDREF